MKLERQSLRSKNWQLNINGSLKQKSGKTGDKHISDRGNVSKTLTIWVCFQYQITEKAWILCEIYMGQEAKQLLMNCQD
jgi:hypothetical protein